MKKKRIVEMEVNELTDVKVKAISLVDHGAIRQPFVKLKSAKGKGMSLNLNELFFGKKSEAEEPAAPVISAVLVKNEAVAAAMEIIGDRAVVKEDEKGGATAIYLDGNEQNPLDVLKLDDNASVIVPGLHKSFGSWESYDDFGKNIAAGGFYPSVYLASDSLTSTIYGAMDKSEPGVAPVEKIKAALNDFGEYVIRLVEAVPAEAFKFEGLAKNEAPLVITEISEGPAVATKADLEVAVAKLGEQIKAVDKPELKLDGVAKSEEVAGLKAAIEKSEAEVVGLKDSLKEIRDAVGLITVASPAGDMVKTVKEEEAGHYDKAFKLEGFE